jgi:hypothetical protein
MLIVDQFMIQHSLHCLFTETAEERDTVQNELLTAYFQERRATKSQIADLLKCAGLG